MEKKLEVKNLQISFRTQGGNVKAVRDISFDLYKGETLAIVGESGSGKSVTSKAIIGILAPNSIIEGGEILYDGQDLLKISEEDFHKLRGDKISMIFQDPLSSLNPIVRIGKQLTEAMILKGKTSQKNAKIAFNQKLKLLKGFINTVKPEQVKETEAACNTFDQFCITGTQLELEFNRAHEFSVDLQLDLEEVVFLVENRQKVDLYKKLKEIIKKVDGTIHPYVVLESEMAPYKEKINNIISSGKDALNQDSVIYLLKDMITLIETATQREKPNYFTLGYYKMKNPAVNISEYQISDLNSITREFLDRDFMIDFIKLGSLGVEASHKKSIENKKAILAKTDDLLEYFRQDNLDKKETEKKITELGKLVSEAIDRLSIHKKSIEYCFYNSIKNEVDSYFRGVKYNPINQAKYEKQMVKYNKLAERGQKPTWKVVPPVLVDLELEKKNIRHVIHALRRSIREDIENDSMYNSHDAMIELVDFFKEQASNVVYRVTHKMAKAKALKLLEEVGIPQPKLRYNQYPFEFSGGMRQRIVIAIALSANPDILICDEPTTALDVTIQSQILELINRIKEERQLSVIFITHDLGVVANMADRIAVMYAGKIVEYGTSEDIFYDPRHPYTWALLSSMPDLETKEKLEAIPGTPPNMIYPPKGDAFAERNKYALEIDFELQPPLFEVTETHYAATWLLHPNAPKVNPPKIITERIERMKKEANINE